MLLLNAVRALIILIGVLMLYTVELAYHLNELGLMIAGAPVLVAVLCMIDVADARLIAYFNPEEKKP